MRKELLFAFAAFFFMSLSAITAVYAVENSNKIITVSEDKADVTGDGKKDTIFIKGVPFEEGTAFLKEVFMEVAASNGKTYKVELEGGYEPIVQFEDLNHDGVSDIFVSVETGGTGGLSNNYLYTLKDFILKDLTVPDPLVIQSQFLNGYKASMTIQETGKSYTFDLRDRAKDYDRLGLYQNGKLSEPTELMVDSYGALKPIQMENGQFGLRGVQSISGAYHADTIAYVESIWFYDKGKWLLKDTKVMETIQRKSKSKEDRRNG